MSLTKIRKSNIESNVKLPHANAAFDTANSSSVYANAAFAVANSAAAGSVDAYARDTSNSASSYANGAFTAANNAVDSYVRDAANAASSYANSAYTEANTRATISYVDNAVANLVNSAPATLDTLNELATALNNDPNFATTIATNIGIIGNYSNAAYVQANTANTTAQAAFTAANNAVDSYVRDAANSASSYANSGFGKANTANTLAQAAYDAANNAVDSYVRDAANAASSYANSAYLQANTPSQVANSASSYANGAFTAANTAANSYALAQAAYDQANTGGGSSNSFYVNIVHDSFVASGSQNTFTLSTEPIDENYVLISFDGVVQHKSTYNVVSSNIEFTTIPDTNTEIDIVSYTRLGAGLFNLSIVLDTFTGDGTTNTFSLSTLPDDKNYTSIIIDGVAQLKTSYNISGSSLIFTESPDSGANIDVTIYTSAVTEENIRVDLAYNHANAAYEQANTVISLASRTSAASSTGNIADAATANVTVAGFKGYLLYKVQTSAAAWVRLYTSVAARTSDSARLENVDPLPGSGVIAEIISTAAETILITPGTIGFNDESSPNTDIALAVTNKSGNTANITVTLTIVQVES